MPRVMGREEEALRLPKIKSLFMFVYASASPTPQDEICN